MVTESAEPEDTTYDYLWHVEPPDDATLTESPLTVDVDALHPPTTSPTPRPTMTMTPTPTPTMSLSTGERFSLDRGVIVGRLPNVRSVGPTDPVLVAVQSIASDISRNHLHAYLEGNIVLVRDLDSTNGTLLRRPGEAVVRIPSDQPTLVRADDAFDLGEGIIVSFEGLE